MAINQIFLSFILTSGFMVLLLPNPIHSLLFLIVVFVSVAGILMAFNLSFLSLLLLIIYVGAIAVLFLFMLMMLDINLTSIIKTDWLTYLIFSLVLISILYCLTYFNMFPILTQTSSIIINDNQWVNLITEINNCETFGHLLYSYYLSFLLLAGLILLLALLGAVTLTFNTNEIAYQKDFEQIARKVQINLINI